MWRVGLLNILETESRLHGSDLTCVVGGMDGGLMGDGHSGKARMPSSHTSLPAPPDHVTT